jgi:hypothetical protein
MGVAVPMPGPPMRERAPSGRRPAEPLTMSGSIAGAAGDERTAKSRRASASCGCRARARSGGAKPPRDIDRPFTSCGYASSRSMPSWQSLPPRRPPDPNVAVFRRTIELFPAALLADGFPGSPGPSERRVNASRVNARLTPRLVSGSAIEALAATLLADGLPLSRGPAEPRVNGSRVSARLVPRGAATRNVARRGWLDGARARQAGQPPGDRRHDGALGATESCAGSGGAAGAAWGAWRWRRRAS